VSSSSIRSSLGEGKLDWPKVALGRPYAVDGEVVSGAGRGKGLGYPTANLRTWPRLLLPGQGIYAGVAQLFDGSRYAAAVDVGTNPTFGVEPLHVEAFLIDFPDVELRGQQIAVEFWERLRDEVRFDEVDELVAAIADDVERTRVAVRLD
jgi:riboflavin kinase/FMN adenylyltransferase